VNLEGNRLILGVSVSLGEQKLHWQDFLKSLVERGLNGVVYPNALQFDVKKTTSEKTLPLFIMEYIIIIQY
jgi:transposase-like protein